MFDLPALRSLSVSAIAIALPVASLQLQGCDSSSPEETHELRSVSDDMLVSNSFQMESKPGNELIATPQMLPSLEPLVSDFLADGQSTSDPLAIFDAQVVTFLNFGSTAMEMQRTANGLRWNTSTGDFGVQWQGDFDAVVFHTPMGPHRIDVAGTREERRRMAAILTVLALEGVKSPTEFLQAGEGGGGIVASTWAVVALLFLLALVWSAVCLAWAQSCHDSARALCGERGGSVSAGCGGISLKWSQDQAPTEWGAEFMGGALTCDYQCDPEEDDAPDEPPVVDRPFPDRPEELDENLCPPGEEVVECCYSEQEVCVVESGECTEVTVEADFEFGYCCSGSLE